MTNEEMINALRNCGSTSRDCGLCFYKNHPVCNFQMAIAAADALEADEKRIVELEKEWEKAATIATEYEAQTYELQARIAELETQMPKRGEWISVEDRLPLYGQDVLAARMYGADADGWAYEIVIAHASNARDSVYWNATNITHWMPLPDAPEVEG